MPRPDLSSLSIGYRKIPIIALGKDIYCDSRLIISKLETLYPHSCLTPSTPAEQGLRALFENWTVDGGIFTNTVKLMPYWLDNGLLQNKAFLDDRQVLMGGRRMTAESMQAGRPEGLQHLGQAFEMLETTFLADGREWILGTKGPSTADIDAVWPFEWLVVDKGMKGSLPEAQFGEKMYPRVHAWVRRFMAEVDKGKKAASKPTALDSETLANRVSSTSLAYDEVAFDENDVLGLEKGEEVEVYPSDYGQMGKSTGVIIGLTTNEVVIRNQKGLHLHFPRWNFSIKKVSSTRQIPRSVTSTKKIPKMRLIYHPFSPYTRKVFVLAHELGLAKHITLQKVVVCPVPIAGWSDNNADVAVYNPMAKIPCLVPEDVPDGIFDSRIICEYLQDLVPVKANKDARYWQLRTLHAAADGIMDAAVLITYEVRIRKERGLYFEEWVEGQKQKISRVLDRFEVAATEDILPDPGSGPASMDEVAVAVATAMTANMGYLGIDLSNGRPKLVEWIKKWEHRDSFVKTPPTHDWIVESEVKSASKI
jgi:glutathione S-transferase